MTGEFDPQMSLVEKELYTPIDSEAVKSLKAEREQNRGLQKFIAQQLSDLIERDQYIGHLLGEDLTGSAWDINLQDLPKFSPKGLIRGFKSKFK